MPLGMSPCQTFITKNFFFSDLHINTHIHVFTYCISYKPTASARAFQILYTYEQHNFFSQ